jgi:hypothetical protein
VPGRANSYGEAKFAVTRGFGFSLEQELDVPRSKEQSEQNEERCVDDPASYKTHSGSAMHGSAFLRSNE